MPAIKIEMSNKWKIETAVSVKNIVMNAVKNILKERPDLTLESVITEGLKRM